VNKVPRRWHLEDDERPWTLNSERSWHWSKRASRTKTTREKFFWLAKIEKIPHLEYVSIDVVPLTSSSTGSIADPASHFPAAKAAIDGIVDANVIDDDNGKYIQRITFWSPIRNSNDGLRLVITDRSDNEKGYK
tara:strand:+ start:4216 stop:4617 length:402 start_codon:yes stop_codon:yes gene_type:complete